VCQATYPGSFSLEKEHGYEATVCLQSVYLISSHMTISPRLSPTIFTASDQLLEVGIKWPGNEAMIWQQPRGMFSINCLQLRI